MKRILWPTDFSEPSLWARDWVLFLARTFDANIVALHIVRVPSLELKEFKRALEMEIKGKEKVLEEETRIFTQDGIQLKSEIMKGNPAPAIVQYIQQDEPDICVMGTRGARGWTRFLIGSTTIRVIQSGGVPVLAVREPVIPKIERILVPTDFSKFSLKALDYAIELSKVFRAKIYFLHVVELLESIGQEEAFKKLKKRLDEIRKGIDQRGDIEVSVIKRDQASLGIVEFAEEKEADIIVMATHSRKGLLHFVVGSVTEQVLRESPIPVIVYPPEKILPAEGK